jgi:hypothetical protein
MGERLTIRIFKGVTTQEFRAAAEEVATKYGGAVNWNSKPQHPDRDFRTSHNEKVHAAYLPYLSGADYLFCQKIAAALSVPWIDLRIQEGSLWDYSLYRGAQHLDNFSTLPEYWGYDEQWIATQRGNPQLLADTWGIQVERIEKYLLPWGFEVDEDEGVFSTLRRGKAYPADKNEYGDIWQMFDFLRAVGATDPVNYEATGEQHELRCPSLHELQKT